MNWTSDKILEILDSCADAFTFPVLDNGYVYLAATRMSVYYSDEDWAIVIEVFGSSPRSGTPDTHIYTFTSNLYNRNSSSDYVTEEAYRNYLHQNPYNESRFIYPIDNTDWQDEEDMETVNSKGVCVLRGVEVEVPGIEELEKLDIEPEEDKILTFEFCRFLAGRHRDLVLCTDEERRISVSPSLQLFLQLEEWHHPDVAGSEKPSSSESFIQIANAIVSGNAQDYQSNETANTHWSNWPEAGTL
jgi:hypothetical protein